jgi:hypothetical protein
MLEEQLILLQKEKHGSHTVLPDWFVNDYLETLAKELIRRQDEKAGGK